MKMNEIIQSRPVVAIGVIVGILAAMWTVVIANGLLDGLTDAGRESVTALVLLLIPVFAALIQQKLVTPLFAPNLPAGTVVNKNLPGPNSIVTEDGDGPSGSS